MKNILNWINQTLRVCFYEVRSVLKDSGVVVVIVAATIIYPVLYCSIYKNEEVLNMPIAVIDESQSAVSRDLVRRIDAAPELNVATRATNMAEARGLLDSRKIHGIVHIPSDFGKNLARGEQAFVSTYCDMSSFLYYRAMALGSNFAVLEMSKDIQIQRLGEMGVTGEAATVSATPIPNDHTVVFNSESGFFSFFMPAILVLILHQTLVFGLGMRAGQAREDGYSRKLLPQGSSSHRIIQVVVGTSLSYLAVYAVLAAWVFGVVPRLFSLPHLGAPMDLVLFTLPFLLSVIFFALTLSVFMRNRETGLVAFLFFSVILLFMSGFSWPQSNIRGFWRAFSYLFPSTHGIQGYIKINTMGATLRQVSPEYIALWIQAGFYFITACFAMKPRKVQ